MNDRFWESGAGSRRSEKLANADCLQGWTISIGSFRGVIGKVWLFRGTGFSWLHLQNQTIVLLRFGQ
jgi:hypothetical protein